MTTKKLIATTAMAALAVPAAALADKPAQPGSQGKAKAEQQKTKPKGVGFSVGGVDLSGLTVTDGKLAGALTLDPTSANSHARKFLELTKTELKGQDTVSFGTAGDAVIVKYEGLTATDAVQPTDRVKVGGKLVGRKGTTKTLDIRKITVTRPETETTTAPTTTTAQSKSTTSSTAPGQVCRNESRKKTNKGKGKSPFAACVVGAKRAEKQADAAKTADERKSPSELCKDQSRKKSGDDKKSPYAACVSGAAKAQNDDKPEQS